MLTTQVCLIRSKMVAFTKLYMGEKHWSFIKSNISNSVHSHNMMVVLGHLFLIVCECSSNRGLIRAFLDRGSWLTCVEVTLLSSSSRSHSSFLPISLYFGWPASLPVLTPVAFLSWHRIRSEPRVSFRAAWHILGTHVKQ